MKTIQEHLRDCNREEVIGHYIYKHTFSPLVIMENKDKTIGEIMGRQRELLSGLIDRLIGMTPKPEDDETWILMTVHVANDDNDVEHILVKKSDVMDEDSEFITPYGYEFSPHEDIIRFCVADNYLTQYHLVDLIADFLYEASWTGYEQEHLQETIKDLEEAHSEIVNGDVKMVPFETFVKNLEEAFDYVPERENPLQKYAWRKWLKQCAEYNKICQRIEMSELRILLRERK